jgi:hypothetical protein
MVTAVKNLKSYILLSFILNSNQTIFSPSLSELSQEIIDYESFLDKSPECSAAIIGSRQKSITYTCVAPVTAAKTYNSELLPGHRLVVSCKRCDVTSFLESSA